MSTDTILSIKEFSEKTKLQEYVVRRMVKEGKTVYFCCGNKVYLHYERTINKLFESKDNLDDKLFEDDYEE
ncbi:hypothetical protein [Longibaculum muris]|uniref:hypothetical protein n=1 Tax=Longibaculum muris TaxID=1796628 RepID=UPI0022E47F66|nr:hypothetical protein [Longibaculum muris]